MEEGASPHQVDQVLEDFGMTLGGHKTMDLAGKGDIRGDIKGHITNLSVILNITINN